MKTGAAAMQTPKFHQNLVRAKPILMKAESTITEKWIQDLIEEACERRGG